MCIRDRRITPRAGPARLIFLGYTEFSVLAFFLTLWHHEPVRTVATGAAYGLDSGRRAAITALRAPHSGGSMRTTQLTTSRPPGARRQPPSHNCPRALLC